MGIWVLSDNFILFKVKINKWDNVYGSNFKSMEMARVELASEMIPQGYLHS